MNLTHQLVRKGACIYRAGDISGLDYGQPAMDEAKLRARMFADKRLPDLGTPHGFDDPYGFVAASRRRGERWAMIERAYNRFLAVIVRRDDLL